MKKVLVIVGPNASGKSDLAVRLAKKFKGEIISADSRQVYKGFNIGSGKITKKEAGGIPHHLLDVADPRKQFSASDFVMLTNLAIAEIVNRDRLPIMVGGTGFYIDAVAGNVQFPDVAPNPALRKKLFKKSPEELFKMLKKKDPRRARTIDRHNKIRLVRALEIVAILGKVPMCRPATSTHYKHIWIGLKPNDTDRRIRTRLKKRWPGIVREIKKLLKEDKITYKRLQELGLEYRYASQYVKGKLSKKEAFDKLFIAIRQYAKRQMTWFKRNKKIRWFKPEEFRKIEKYAKVSLKGD